MLQSSNTVILSQVSSDTVASAIKSNNDAQCCYLLIFLDVVKERDRMSLNDVASGIFSNEETHNTHVCLFVCVCLQADAIEDPIHAVLGGPEPDVDTVAATLCIALHLSQV